MQISLQSKVYLGTCIAIQAYSVYSNPTRAITCLVLGLLLGTVQGRSELRAAREGHQPGNNMGMGWNEGTDQEVKERAVNALVNSAPGIYTAAINLLALGLLTQKVQIPTSWSPKWGTYFCDFATLNFGAVMGHLFQLDALRKIEDPYVQKLLANTVI